MKLESKNHLWNMLQALKAVLEFTKGHSLADYRSNLMMRAAVEREFIMMGEALRRLERTDPELAKRIANRAQIVAFRNVLVHDYDRISDEVVWDTVNADVGPLIRQIESLLNEP
jgi:uncharacterized protein with HEPN domain